MLPHILIDRNAAIGPLPRRRVRTNQQHSHGGDDDDDSRNDKGDAPRDMWFQALGLDEGVEDGRHHEVSDAATGVAEAGSEGVGGADDVLVEEAGCPDLAWDEGAAEDADEEADGKDAGFICCAALGLC